MSPPDTYENLRQLVDSWGLAAMTILFVGLVAWPFRRGGKKACDEAARSILEDDDNE